MSFLDRIAANRRIPSGPSHTPNQQALRDAKRYPHGVQAFSAIGDWWKDLQSKGYYSNPTYSQQVTDREKIFDGKLEISLSRGDILVIPEGRIDEVPEKYRSRVVEVPHLFDFSVIS